MHVNLLRINKSYSPDSVREVEIGGGEGLDVVDVDVVDGEALPGAEVEAATYSVHLEVAVDLAALLQRVLLVDKPLAVLQFENFNFPPKPILKQLYLALLDAPGVELPCLLGVGVLDVLTRVTALALLSLGPVAAAAGHHLLRLGGVVYDLYMIQ